MRVKAPLAFLAGVALAGGALWPVAGTGAGAATAVARLTAVRAAAHPGYDRLVFQFAGPVPSRRSVSYVRQVVQDPSGRTVRLTGRALLRVVLDPATAHTAAGAPTYAGRLPTAFDLPVLAAVRQVGDFENVLSFGVGLWQRTALHVFTLTDPSRLVVDLAVPRAAPAKLNGTDNGRLVYLKVGQRTTVGLHTCVSCGYSWRVATSPNPAVVRVVASSVVPLPHPPGVVGSPSETRWTLLAKGTGRTSLVLSERPPQPGAAPVARYVLRFAVSR